MVVQRKLTSIAIIIGDNNDDDNDDKDNENKNDDGGADRNSYC